MTTEATQPAQRTGLDIDDETLIKHIGSRIRLRRRELNLSLKEVAEACTMRFQQLQKLEAAKNRPFADTLWRIAIALDVPISYFYEDLPCE